MISPVSVLTNSMLPLANIGGATGSYLWFSSHAHIQAIFWQFFLSHCKKSDPSVTKNIPSFPKEKCPSANNVSFQI